MFRVLLVDDEARVINGMYEFLQEAAVHLELEILRAYTVYEALELSKLTKIDILLTDIKMPGMNGLELSKRIVELWPQCKAIYLSAYNDFDYVQDAIRQGGFDYILKIEGDENVLKAIEKAVRQIEQDWANEQLIQNSLKKMHMAFPSLRKELFLDIFAQRGLASAVRKKKFEELGIGLNAERPVIQVLGKVDRWPPESAAADRALFLYCIQNIAEEYLGGKVRFASFDYDRYRFVWLLQPIEPEPDETGWIGAIRFSSGMLETIQATYSSLLKLSVSLAINTAPAPWEEAGLRFQSFLMQVSYGSLQTAEAIVSDAFGGASQGEETMSSLRGEMDVRLKLKQLDRLESLIDNGQREEARSFLTEVLDSNFWQRGGGQPLFSTEVFFSLSAFWLGYINRRGLMGSKKEELEIHKLTRLDLFHSWGEATTYFFELAERLADYAEARQAEQSNELIGTIHAFVNSRLNEELSLTRIGEFVHLNPSYLSRIYKQTTGKGLLEYITEMRVEKAKKLLKYSVLKIHEIVSEVGFESGPYFTRLFKKSTGTTPQEYRDNKIGHK